MVEWVVQEALEERGEKAVRGMQLIKMLSLEPQEDKGVKAEMQPLLVMQVTEVMP